MLADCTNEARPYSALVHYHTSVYLTCPFIMQIYFSTSLNSYAFKAPHGPGIPTCHPAIVRLHDLHLLHIVLRVRHVLTIRPSRTNAIGIRAYVSIYSCNVQNEIGYFVRIAQSDSSEISKT